MWAFFQVWASHRLDFVGVAPTLQASIFVQRHRSLLTKVEIQL
jgi:hypothetical protein